jgi:pSer/pThr/pTyr-binding forkhead associated (FHA) protein/subtilisin family serine protease
LPPSLGDLVHEYPELATVLGDTSLSSVYKDFLIAYESGGIEAARELALQRGLLNERGEIRITLVLDDAQQAELISGELQGAGITVEGFYRERINVGVPMSLIERLAAEQGTQALFQQLTRMEHIVRIELPVLKRVDGVERIEGEGVGIIGADKWHAAGITGEGIRVGVLDLGFRGYLDLLGSELPADVVAKSFVYGESPEGSSLVHGTACAEIVHETAPGAELFLAYYDGSMVTQGQAVDWLLEQGVHIISHSAGASLGPMDGTGEDAEFVDEVSGTGVLWVNSAGNEAESHYRGQFNDSDGNNRHEFPDGDEKMAVWPYTDGFTIILNWDDWESVTEDFELYLYDSRGDLIASARDTQDGSVGQMAAEGIELTHASDSLYYVVIEAYQATRPVVFDLYADPMEIEFPVPEHSLGTPGDARGALTVGATEYRDDSLASYSSRGPTNDGRLKPEISAPAGVSGASYGEDGFDGTSASTPYVAGAAALVMSAHPELDISQVIDYLQTQVIDLGAAGPDNGFGHGRLSLPEPDSVAEQPATVPAATQVVIETVVPTVGTVATSPSAPPATRAPGDLATGSADRGLSTTLLAVVATTGLCGAAITAGGVALLLVAWRRSRPPADQETPPVPAVHYTPVALERPPTADARRYGALGGAGIAPVPLMPGVTTLGRSSDVGLRLHSLQVSRYHAQIECSADGCRVTDLQSANGTFVNGRRVEAATLVPGDRLRLGDVQLTYLRAETDAPSLSGGQPRLEVDGVYHAIPAEGLLIGRAADCGLCLSDGQVSRHHAQLEPGTEGIRLVDLDSANGTRVNGRLVRRYLLQDGDVISLGESRLVFHEGREG